MNAAPIRLSPGPQGAVMTACEVLNWFGFGISKTIEQLQEDTDDLCERWMTANFAALRAALDARTARAPYCAVERRITVDSTEAQQAGFYADIWVSPRGPKMLREIRARARRRTGRLVSYADLAIELREELEAEALMQAATANLLEALRAKKLTAYGLKNALGGPPSGYEQHDPIPFSVFLHPDVTITIWNDVKTLLPASRRGPNYYDVRFTTAEVLRLWPAAAGRPKGQQEKLEDALRALQDDGEDIKNPAGSLDDLHHRTMKKAGIKVAPAGIETQRRTFQRARANVLNGSRG